MSHKNRYHPNLRWTTSTIVAIAMLVATGARAQTIAFDIPAQPLASALNEFSKQSGRAVTAPAAILRDKTAPAIKGTMTPDQALELLLQNTELHTATTPGGTQIIQQAQDINYQTGSEIVVTGTHIRGAAPAGSSLYVLDRTDIERTGLGTAAQVIQAMPQNFRGGINEEVRDGADYSQNAFGGAAANLRGLGADSTLVLLDGRRLPGGGIKGSFVDISMIPISAIERIEVLTDGASAIYGADAVAGVVNFVMKQDYNEAESRLRYGAVTSGSLDEFQASQSLGRTWGGTSFFINYEYQHRDPLAKDDVNRTRSADMRRYGGADHRNYFSNPGNILDPVFFQPAYAIPAGQDGRSLSVSDLLPGQVNLQEPDLNSDISAGQSRHSVFFSGRQEITDALSISANLIYGRRSFDRRLSPDTTFFFVPASHPYYVNPFDGDYVAVAYSLHNEFTPKSTGRVIDKGAILAANYAFSGWEARLSLGDASEKSKTLTEDLVDYAALDAAINNPDPAQVFNPFGSGNNTSTETLNVIRMSQKERVKSEIRYANLIIDGEIISLPAGSAGLAVGLDYRREKFDHDVHQKNKLIIDQATSRKIYAAFSELSIPAVSPDMEVPFINAMRFSAAIRMDDYSGIGRTHNPKFGGTWEVLPGLAVRGSYGTSFRPPAIDETDGSQTRAVIVTLPDAAAPGGFSRVLYLGGVRPDIKNEKSKAWTVGADIRPPALPSLSFNVTYFDIKYRDRIESPRIPDDVLNRITDYSGLVTLTPNQAELDQYCLSPLFMGSPEECQAGFIAAIIDTRLQNTAYNAIRGLDANINYAAPLWGGEASISVNGSYIIDFVTAPTDSAPRQDWVSRLGYPVDFRMRTSAFWSSNDFTSGLFINYTNSYQNDRVAPNQHIDDYLTFDAQVSYTVRGKSISSILNNMSISLSVQNIFAKDPPFVDWSLGYDPANASAIGRFIALEVRKTW